MRITVLLAAFGRFEIPVTMPTELKFVDSLSSIRVGRGSEYNLQKAIGKQEPKQERREQLKPNSLEIY